MPSNRGRWVHGRYNCNSFHLDEIKIGVIEALVTDDLLQEGDQLNCVIFVWTRQVDVLEIDDESLAFFGAVDATMRIGRLSAHRIQLLDHACGRSLCIAVNNSHLCRFHLLDQARDD